MRKPPLLSNSALLEQTHIARRLHVLKAIGPTVHSFHLAIQASSVATTFLRRVSDSKPVRPHIRDSRPCPEPGFDPTD